MIPTFRAALLVLAALGGCTQAQHPIDRHLSQLRPVTVAPLPDLNWPAGTLLCPLTPYQSQLSNDDSRAQGINTFLKRTAILRDEGHWSLVVVKPATAGTKGIEHLLFKRGNYDVITSPSQLQQAAETLPERFVPRTCVPVEHARVLVARARSTHRTLIMFGTE